MTNSLPDDAVACGQIPSLAVIPGSLMPTTGATRSPLLAGLPTVILFKDGKMVERIQGARPTTVYIGHLDALVDNATLTAV